MKNKKLLLLLPIFAMVFSSCQKGGGQNSNTSSDSTPTSSTTSEIEVNEELFEYGETVHGVFDYENDMIVSKQPVSSFALKEKFSYGTMIYNLRVKSTFS